MVPAIIKIKNWTFGVKSRLEIDTRRMTEIFFAEVFACSRKVKYR
jgi:hypothetical protein